MAHNSSFLLAPVHKRTPNKKHHKQKQADLTGDALPCYIHPHRSSPTALLRHPNSPEQSLVGWKVLGTSPWRKPSYGGPLSRFASSGYFCLQASNSQFFLLNLVWGIRISIYSEPQMVFYVWKTAANYFMKQGK